MNEEPEISIDPEKELAKLPLVYRILGRVETVGNSSLTRLCFSLFWPFSS